MPDVLVRAIDRAAGLRVLAAITTDLAREAARRHEAEGLGACALGRALTSGLLLATLTKGEERVTLQIHGDGPIGNVTVDAHVDPGTTGDVRGFISHAHASALPCVGRGLVAEVVGRGGVVNVIRDIGLKDRYQGQVALLTGEIDEDVEGYLRGSEQVPSALGCDVLLRDGLAIDASAGVLVQAMPGSADGAVIEAQHAVRTGAVYRYLAGGGTSARDLALAVYGRPLEFLDEQPLVFKCRCSPERVRSMLDMLSAIEIDEIIADRGEAEVVCNFCNTRYVIGRADLEAIRAERAGSPRGDN